MFFDSKLKSFLLREKPDHVDLSIEYPIDRNANIQLIHCFFHLETLVHKRQLLYVCYLWVFEIVYFWKINVRIFMPDIRETIAVCIDKEKVSQNTMSK